MAEKKRLNPFQSFIVKAKAAQSIDVNSRKENSSGKESSLEFAKDVNSANDENNWVHYIDDETGYPYMYNSVTGEARWLSEGEYQDFEPAVITIESPWETLYDDNGNIYYYNKVCFDY